MKQICIIVSTDLKKMFAADEKMMKMINNQLTDEFGNLKEKYGEDSLDLI